MNLILLDRIKLTSGAFDIKGRRISFALPKVAECGRELPARVIRHTSPAHSKHGPLDSSVCNANVIMSTRGSREP